MEYAKQPGSSISSDWLKDVGRQLVRKGADPNRCKPLLEPPDRSSDNSGEMMP